MSKRMLGDLTRVVGNPHGFDGYLYIQELNTTEHHYKVLFTPLGSSASGCKDGLEEAIGCTLDGVHLEMKFFLAEDMVTGLVEFSTPKELGHQPLNMAALNELGLGLALSIREIQAQVRPDGIAALALDERPQLQKFYKRLYRNHAAILSEYGYKPKMYLGGQGYALFEQNFAARLDDQAQSA